MSEITTEKMEAQAEAHRQNRGIDAPNGETVIPDRYTIQDDEGNYIDRSRSEDELNENLEVLGKSRSDLVKEFQALNTFEQKKIFNSFEEEAQAIINEIDTLKGDLYTKEGKQAEKNKRLNQLAIAKKEEVSNVEKEYEENQSNLLNKMSTEINSNSKQLTDNEIAEINLKSNEIEGQIKGELYSINNTRDLEFHFKILVDVSKDDKILSRYLANNFYLFLEKAEKLETGDMDINRAIHNITKLAESVKDSNYTDEEKALIYVKNITDKKSFGLYDDRLIDKHLQNYLK